MPLLNLVFLGLDWPWVGEFVGFIIITICFPTQQNEVNREHPSIAEIEQKLSFLAKVVRRRPVIMAAPRPHLFKIQSSTGGHTTPCHSNRVLAIYQIMLGWKTCKHYYETDELPNPRPTQPKKEQVKSCIWATFSHSKYFLRGMGQVLYRKQTTRNLTQSNSPQTP